MAPATYPDPNLEPQNQSSFEIGTDLRFFNGRIRLVATYYYNKTTKNIVRLDVANSTGFFYMRKNAGTITNEGVEIMAGFTPVETRNFSWDLDVNFASNRQLVKKLDPSITSYTLSAGFNSLQIKAAEGEPFSLYGTYWMTDDEGNYIIKDDGTRAVSETTKNLGKVAPDWTMGISNTLRYRNLSLSFLIDVRYGGVMYSGTVSDLRVNGMAEETIGKNRTDIVDKGVKQDGTENTTAITPLPVLVEQLQLESVRGQRLRRHLRQTARNGAQLPDAAALVQELLHRFAGTGRRGPQPVAHEVERAAHRSRNQHLRPVGRRFGRRILGDSHDPKLGLQHQINLLNKQDV